MSPKATDSIRQAVAAGEFHRAEGLWNDYAAGLREELCRGGLGSAEWKEAGELLQWCRLEVLCARTRALEQLNRLRVALAYENLPARLASSLVRTDI